MNTLQFLSVSVCIDQYKLYHMQKKGESEQLQPYPIHPNPSRITKRELGESQSVLFNIAAGCTVRPSSHRREKKKDLHQYLKYLLQFIILQINNVTYLK